VQDLTVNSSLNSLKSPSGNFVTSLILLIHGRWVQILPACRRFGKSIARGGLARTSSIGATLAAVVASPIFGQSADVNPARAAAMRECNKLASPYLIYTWGNWQIYVYRRCMAKHGQIE